MVEEVQYPTVIFRMLEAPTVTSIKDTRPLRHNIESIASFDMF